MAQMRAILSMVWQLEVGSLVLISMQNYIQEGYQFPPRVCDHTLHRRPPLH